MNSLWEGCGNIMCLDVLRAIRTEPASLEALLSEIRSAQGADERFDRHLESLLADLTTIGAEETLARRLVGRLAVGLQGSVLMRFGAPSVAEAFLASLSGDQPIHKTLEMFR